ncbi:MAG: nucleotidyltransferase family protein [Kiloniellales bacterium]|nr:nucleotidyltransferase family protein [Kiloniellales bacterium]
MSAAPARSQDSALPRRAMVLAAGRGERMRPLTERLPKPLIEVGGKAMLDWALDHLAAAGVADVVVNLYHLGERIEAHVQGRGRPRVTFSREAELMDTGGGVAAALDRLGPDAFYVLNGDVVWLNGLQPALQRLARAWDEDEMDALLLLQPVSDAYGYDGHGDFVMDPAGRLRRRREREVAPFVFAGVQLLHPRLFDGAPEGPFSLNLLYDRAIEAGRLAGLRHDGRWFHVGTPEALQGVEQALHHLSDFKNRI